MDINTVSQMVTVVLAVLAIIWHQQRSTDKLRGDFERAHDKFRGDFGQAVDKLRDSVTANGERLARIEGFLRIGVPKTPGQDPEPPPEE